MKLHWSTISPLIAVCSSLLLPAGCTHLQRTLCPEVPAKTVQAPVKPDPQVTAPRGGGGTVEKIQPRESKTEEILAYFHYVQGLPEADQAREFARLKKDFEKSSDYQDRFRLICLSLLPGKPFTDRDYAFKLVQGSLGGDVAGDDGLKGLALVLTLLVGRQQDLQHALAVEKDRADTLARQLKELQEIEKILNEREKKRLPGK